ncbi:FAD-dependent oxidoreductase [Actinomadura sp. NPDC048394]|uniref:NAD(P)/FAD-dependent oxidoreductase n=1 Tax=Actinomadura sp. NPDC048394 TaxID=3158223 RepID=UPI0033D7E907
MPDRIGESARIVIVGTGIAGATAALTLRAEGYQGGVVLVGSEHAEPYRRPPLSKDLLAGRTSTERIRLRSAEAWAVQHIDLRSGVTATALDRARRTVQLSDRTELGYDRLLLATGGRPRTIEGVPTLRTREDALALRARLREGGRILIIGAGLIGLETAATASAMGCQVTVWEADDRVLGRVVPGELAAPIAALHREHGVDLRLNTPVRHVTRLPGGGFRAVGDDVQWSGDHVLAAIGIVPETELAAHSGLPVDDGILVDLCLTTFDPAVYAAGDVARLPAGRREHWSDAQAQGATAARNMLGRRSPHTAIPWCWSDQYDLKLQICGRLAGEPVVSGDLAGRDASIRFVHSGDLVGAVCMNRPREHRELRDRIEKTASGAQARTCRAGSGRG